MLARTGESPRPAWPTAQGDTIEDADTSHDVREPYFFSEEAFYPASYAHRPSPTPETCLETIHTAKPKQYHGRGEGTLLFFTRYVLADPFRTALKPLFREKLLGISEGTALETLFRDKLLGLSVGIFVGDNLLGIGGGSFCNS